MSRVFTTGMVLTDYLAGMLKDREEVKYKWYEMAGIKEKMCYVSLDGKGKGGGTSHTSASSSSLSSPSLSPLPLSSSPSSLSATEYELADGTFVRLGPERFHVCEALFSPAFSLPLSFLHLAFGPTRRWRSAKDKKNHPAYCHGLEQEAHACGGIHESVVRTLSAGVTPSTAPVLCRALYGNVVLCGGTALLPGLPERLRSGEVGMLLLSPSPRFSPSLLPRVCFSHAFLYLSGPLFLFQLLFR